jgi:hypothetical protein
MEIIRSYSRDEIIGPSYWKISDFGVAQFRHNYNPELLKKIASKAMELKSDLANNRHLDLNYIRGVQRYIPEVQSFLEDKERLAKLEQLVGVPLEVYPISVITSIVTFMGSEDGTISWHTDGPPLVEIIPLDIDNLEGGETQVYCNNHEIGRLELEENKELPHNKIISVEHKMGFSLLGQFYRVLHRASPIYNGSRMTLNIGYRSRNKPYIDDNSLVYLGADNPDFEWLDQYYDDVKQNKLPAYLKHQN